MYCTYCHKDVSPPHRCEESIQPTAYVDFVAVLPERSKLKGYRTDGKRGYMAGVQRPADEEKEEEYCCLDRSTDWTRSDR